MKHELFTEYSERVKRELEVLIKGESNRELKRLQIRRVGQEVSYERADYKGGLLKAE